MILRRSVLSRSWHRPTPRDLQILSSGERCGIGYRPFLPLAKVCGTDIDCQPGDPDQHDHHQGGQDQHLAALVGSEG